MVELRSATVMQTVNKMWLIFLSWVYKVLTSPSPREMFSPLFPVFVVLKEERGGKKKKPTTHPLFSFLFLLVLLFVSGSQNETFCLPSLPLLPQARASRLHREPAGLGGPASRVERESCSSVRLMCCLYLLG